MYQIFTSFNENYKIVGAACIASLFKNTDSDIEIIVLDTGIKESTKKKFKRWAHRLNRSLVFITISKGSYSEILGKDVAALDDFEYYTRLLVAYYADAGVAKVLYMDADIICLQNPRELFKTNLNGNIIGAVQDYLIKTIGNGIANYSELGLNKNDAYFNSGLMLIDVNNWKSNNVSQDVLLISRKNKKYVIYFDQYALNVVLCNKWMILSNQWNEIKKATKDATIFRHFAGVKPISVYFRPNDSSMFFEHLKLSPFPYWWWRLSKERLFLAKSKWKLQFYSNKYFKTSFDLTELDVK